jgi:hypothetical protein
VLYSQSPLGAPAVLPVLPISRREAFVYLSRGFLGFRVWCAVCHPGVLRYTGQYALSRSIFGYMISVTDAFYWTTTVSVLFGPKMLFWGKVHSNKSKTSLLLQFQRLPMENTIETLQLIAIDLQHQIVSLNLKLLVILFAS